MIGWFWVMGHSITALMAKYANYHEWTDTDRATRYIRGSAGLNRSSINSLTKRIDLNGCHKRCHPVRRRTIQTNLYVH